MLGVTNQRNIMLNRIQYRMASAGCWKRSVVFESFKQRLVDMFIQDWSGTITEKERFSQYRSFKVVFEKEMYIDDFKTTFLRTAMAQFRLGVLPLNNNLYRFSDELCKRNCPCCINAEETEFHFIFACPMYLDLRERMLNMASQLPLSVLQKASNTGRNSCIAKFIVYGMKRRNQALTQEQDMNE